MPDITKANQIIDQIIGNLTELKNSLNGPVVSQLSINQTKESDSYDTFEQLCTALHGTTWPEAVNSGLICNPNSEYDKCERGKCILELMLEDDPKDTKFLDFGCGEGYCVRFAPEFKTSLAVGYDVHPFKEWKQIDDKVVLTTNFDQVKKIGPYDTILVYDVIDHVLEETPQSVISKISQILAPKGKIIMRCHPFTSRHATHLYHYINKAYVHLVFTEDELNLILPGKERLRNLGITRPLTTYDSWIKEAGLTIVNRREVTERVEPFFKIPQIAERIMRATSFQQFPEFQLSLQFVDYVLEKN